MKKQTQKKGKVGAWIRERVNVAAVVKNLPFVLFVAVLGIIYIANAHSAERSMREMSKLEPELKELHWKYLSIKADVMYNQTQTQAGERVKDLDIGLLNGMPVKLTAEKPNLKECN